MKVQGKVYKAVLISNGNEIEVYKLNNGKWCNYKDCTTTYSKNEIKFK